MSDSKPGSDESINGHLTSASRFHLCLYVGPLVVGPLLLLVLAFLIVPSSWYEQHSRNSWLIGTGYGAKLKHADCQVLIYGDSSAEIGIDPAIIQQRTGLSTCNVAELIGMTALNGTLTVDQYLQNNQSPHYLVFLFTPEDLDPTGEGKQHGYFEAITYRLRQPHKLASLLLVMQHPENGFKWVYVGLKLGIMNAHSESASNEIMHDRQNHRGQLTDVVDPPMEHCPVEHNVVPDTAWIKGLRSKYSSTGTTVLIDVMPLPTCDPSLSFFRRELAGVTDNPVNELPESAYMLGGRHVNSGGSKLVSNMLADQLLQQMRSQPGGSH